jgi:hypothetical protein
VVPIAHGEWGGAIDDRFSEEAAIMDGLKMLDVAGVSGGHIPRTVGIEAKELPSSVVFGLLVEEEGEREEGLGPVEEKHVAMSIDGGICILAGEIRNLGRSGNVGAAAIGAVFPIMERALQGFADDMSATEVGSEVGTARVDHRKLTTCRAESDQITSKDTFADGLGAEFVDVTKGVP